MKFTYTDEILTLTADDAERTILREVLEGNTARGFPHFCADDETDFCEGLTANSELDWVRPEDCGDLTDAPLLGITAGEEIAESNRASYGKPVYGWQSIGFWDGEARFSPILHRWGYEPYQVRSFLTDLMETGQAVFRSSW